MKKALPLAALLLSACATAKPETSQKAALIGPTAEYRSFADADYAGLNRETMTTVKLEDPEETPAQVEPAGGMKIMQAPTAVQPAARDTIPRNSAPARAYERSTYNTPSNAVEERKHARRETMTGTIPLKASRRSSPAPREQTEVKE